MVRYNKEKLNRPWFQHDPTALKLLREALQENFPNLHALVENESVIVRGSMPIMHDGQELDRYHLKIVFADNHPYAPATVYEMAKRIPKQADIWHVNPNGSLCLGVPEQIWPSRNKPLNLVEFLNGPVRSFLLRNSIIERGGEWPHGERRHGSEGIFQYYEERIGISDRAAIVEFMKCVTHPNPKGHWECPCGSGKKMRNCHFHLVRALREELSVNAVRYSLTLVQ